MKLKTQKIILLSFFFTTSLILCNNIITNNRKPSAINIFINHSHLKLSSQEEWVKSWGYNDTDHGYSVAIDSYGNSYIAGDTKLNGVQDATIIKYDSSGIYQWHKTWGGSATEIAYSVYVDLSNYVYITGSARSFNTTNDVFIVKYESDGDLIWNRTWGGAGEDYGKDLTVDDQGNVYITGYTTSFGAVAQDTFLITYNSSGYFQGANFWGGSNNDRATSIVLDSNENLFISGETGSYGAGNSDAFLLKYNLYRTLEWNTTWGYDTLDRPNDLAIDSNDDLYISGFTYHPDITTSDQNFFIVKFSSSGLPLWSEIWGSIYIDLGGSVAIDSADNAYYVGYTQGYDAGIQDIHLAKFSSEGVKQWMTSWDGGDVDVVHQICIDKTSNDIFLAGESKGFALDKNYQMMLIKNPLHPESITDNSSDQGIPGYDLILISGILGIMIVIFIKNKGFLKK